MLLIPFYFHPPPYTYFEEGTGKEINVFTSALTGRFFRASAGGQ